MTVRRGVTLIEALVAIFVMAIGLLAILALFPLGAIKMALAIRADRVDLATQRASALAEARDIRHDSAFYNPTAYDFFISNPATVAAGYPALNTPAPGFVGYDNAGYPLFVDPIGGASGMPGTIGTIGGSTLIARPGVSFVAPATNVPAALYWFSLLDDIQFENDGPTSGLVRGINSGIVNRTNRYSYAYLLRRPRYSDTTIVDLSVVVYEKRPIQASSVETVYPSGATPGNSFSPTNPNEVLLTYTTERPPIRKGGWILDATVLPVDASIANQPNMQGYFYRVVDVTDVNGNTIALELEKPLRGLSQKRTFVLMDGVVEVIERSSGWKP